MNRILMAISGQLPCRTINDGNVRYLERYYVATVFGVRMYLHRFVGSDPDCGLHSHPWPWAFSIVLSGYYLEERHGYETEETKAKLGSVLEALGAKPEGVIRRRVRWLNFLTGDTFHRVILPEGNKEVWTLFAHRAKRSKEWGFLRGSIYTTHTSASDAWWKSAPQGKFIRRTPQ